MEFKRRGDLLVIRLDEDDEIIERLITICSRERVEAGIILSLIGAVKECQLIFREGCQEAFKEHFEVLGNGNITILEGQPKIHLHVTCGNDVKVKTGHLVEGTVTVFCEIVVKIMEGFKMERRLDEKLLKEEVKFPYRLTP